MKNTEEIQTAFEGIFDNRSDQQIREDAAQILSFRFLSEVERLMQNRGMSKRELAKAVGTSASYITQLFRGYRLVSIDMLARFEHVFDIQFAMATESSAVIAKRKVKSNRTTKANLLSTIHSV